MDAGTLRTVADLQAPPGAQDSDGQPAGAWTTVAAGIRIDLRHQSGLQAIRGGADTSIVRASARIRWRTNVSAGMRLAVGGSYYAIEAVLPDASRRHVDLVCELVQ